MKSAVFPITDEASVTQSSPGTVSYLAERDMRAFTSRMFLDNALNISHPNGTHSNSTNSVNFIMALKNVCDQFPTNDVIKVVILMNVLLFKIILLIRNYCGFIM